MGDLSHVTVMTTSSVWLTLAFLMPHPMAGTKKEHIALLPTLWALSGSIQAAAAYVQGQHLTGHP